MKASLCICFLIFAIASALEANVRLICWEGERGPTNTLSIAYHYPNGGGYRVDTNTKGLPETIIATNDLDHTWASFGPNTDGTTYCSGFTFAVALKAAYRRGLLTNQAVTNLTSKFRPQWYGAVPGFEEMQCVAALTNLQIGEAIALTNARPGDFVQFFRAIPKPKTEKFDGHSVIFVRWIYPEKLPQPPEMAQPIGFIYRSTQANPWPPERNGQQGVGDSLVFLGTNVSTYSGYALNLDRHHHFFADTNRIHVGRLYPSPPPIFSGHWRGTNHSADFIVTPGEDIWEVDITIDGRKLPIGVLCASPNSFIITNQIIETSLQYRFEGAVSQDTNTASGKFTFGPDAGLGLIVLTNTQPKSVVSSTNPVVTIAAPTPSLFRQSDDPPLTIKNVTPEPESATITLKYQTNFTTNTPLSKKGTNASAH
jgi:hypothetical protein